MQEYFKWEVLATQAGATLFTTMVTQYVKQISWLENVPTQVITYVIALLGLISGTAFTSGLTLESALLCVVNAVVICVASNGTYDNIKEATKK